MKAWRADLEVLRVAFDAVVGPYRPARFDNCSIRCRKIGFVARDRDTLRPGMESGKGDARGKILSTWPELPC